MDINYDNILYYIDWGDGTNIGWLGQYPSGTELSLTHSWMFQGTYLLKAKDELGLESDWATLDVSMPKSRRVGVFFNRFFSVHLELFCSFV
jgi:hypothetical protein